MKYVLVKGVHFGNKGAEMMFLAIKQQIDKTHDDIRLVLAPGPQSSFERRMRHQTYQLLSLAKGMYDFNWFTVFVPSRIRRFIRQRFGIVFEWDLSAILDASGFAYGDDWPIANSSRAATQAKRMKSSGGAYIFLPQAFGPFSRRRDQHNMKQAFSSASVVYARDEISRRHASKIFNVDRIAPDFTCILANKNRDQPRSGLIIVPNANMVSARSAWTKDKYFGVIVLVCKAFRAKHPDEKIKILNHEGDGDVEVCRDLSTLLRGMLLDHDLIQTKDALDAKFQISTSRLVFSSRYHACISALTSGVLCFATSWAHKYEQLYKFFDLESAVLEDASEKSILNRVQSIIETQNLLEERIRLKAEDMTETSLKMLNDVISEINS